MSQPSFYRYWGKARPFDDSAAAYHLLPYHCLDVAAVATAYLVAWVSGSSGEPDAAENPRD